MSKKKKKATVLRKTDIDGTVYQFSPAVFDCFTFWCSKVRGKSLETPGFTAFYQQLSDYEKQKIEIIV